MTIEKHEETNKPSPARIWFPFFGGLGDVILRCYETRFWHFLENTDDPVEVAISSVNPFTTELFRWHKNRSRIVIYELSHLFDDFTRRGLSGNEFHEAIARFAGLAWPIDWKKYKAPPPPGWTPTFYAPDYLDDGGHLIFHAFAGLEHRSLSGESLHTVIRSLGNLPCTVYVPSRDFVRFHAGRAGHGAEEFPDMPLPDNFVLLKNLSVPATLNLIRNAAGFVGTHSSLVLAAAKEGIPSLAFYPEFLASKFDSAEGYASYVKLDHMTALPFGSASDSSLDEWFSRTFKPGMLINGRAEQSRVDRLARWILAKGGRINIDWYCAPDFIDAAERRKFRNLEIDSVDVLPKGRYIIWRMNFGNLANFGDWDLSELRENGLGIETITNLNLANTGTTADGIHFLDWLSCSLQKIDLGADSTRVEITKKIASILPDTALV